VNTYADLAAWARLMKSVTEDLMSVSEPEKKEDASQVPVVVNDADDGNSGHYGYADGDNAYHDDDYFHTETKNDDAGVVQDLRAHHDNQMNDYGNSVEACYMVNVALDDMENGANVDTIDACRGMEVGPHYTSSVN
jgi:hypothetical protein